MSYKMRREQFATEETKMKKSLHKDAMDFMVDEQLSVVWLTMILNRLKREINIEQIKNV